MSPEFFTALTNLLLALGGLSGIGAVFKIGIDRRKAKIDASQVVSDTAVELIGPLRDEVVALRADGVANRAESAALRRDVRELVEYVNILIGELHANGLPIPPRPASTP